MFSPTIYYTEEDIETLSQDVDSLSDELSSLESELRRVHAQNEMDRQEHQQELGKLYVIRSHLDKTLDDMTESLMSKISLHEYIAQVRNSGEGSDNDSNDSGGPARSRTMDRASSLRTVSESSYVLRLQSQLCKSLHQRGCLESQLYTIKDGQEGWMKFYHEEGARLAEERTSMEVDYMNQLFKIDVEKRALQSDFDRRWPGEKTIDEDENEEKLDEMIPVPNGGGNRGRSHSDWGVQSFRNMLARNDSSMSVSFWSREKDGENFGSSSDSNMDRRKELGRRNSMTSWRGISTPALAA